MNRSARGRRSWNRWARVARVSVLALAPAAQAATAQTGILVGRVTDALTGAPVRTARVTVAGTALGAAVDTGGRFLFVNVPVSAGEVQARSLGYKPTAAAFVLVPNETITVALSMNASTLELDAIMVTGSVGDTRRRAVGHSVAVVDASAVVSRSAVANLTEVLQAKVPGLTIMPGSGTVGTAANYRLRGAGSLATANNPTIYLDGVRLSARTQGNYSSFGQSTTSLDALSPADIESIEVIKGPAASTLYGAEAAAGVIQIFTRKGRPGRLQWESRVEIGRSDWDEDLRPVNFAFATAGRLADTVTWPGFKGKSLGDVIAVRPMTDGRAVRTAGLSKLVLSASGGADRYTFRISAARSNEEGVYFNNFSNLRSIRGNFAFVPTNELTVATTVALSTNHIRLPLSDNSNVGLIRSSYIAEPGRSYSFPGGPNYLSITPEEANTYDNQTRADRYTIGATAEYAPAEWFRNTVRVGLDANVGRAELYFAPGLPPRFPARHSLDFDNTKGFFAEGRPLTRDLTLNYDGTLTHRLSERLVSHTSVGMQYLANRFQRTDAIGVDLGTVGVRSVAAAAVRTGTDSLSERKSVGLYAQQQLALRDRIFVTLAARVDNNSAFGSRLNHVFYPKASISYVISEEPYFHVPGVSSLRLRAAWGQAGNAPGAFDARRSYTSSVVTYVDGTSSALRYASVGNPDLRPERGSELEVGFEAGFIGDRVRLDASYYDKATRDALIPVPVAPSTGFTGSQLTNLGETSNTGIEMLLTTIPVQRKSLTISATLLLATNRNALVSVGDERPYIPFQFNAPQRFQEGFPLGAMWAQRTQSNADGSLAKDDKGRLVLDTVYRGPSVPTREMSLSGGLRLFGRLHVYGLADYKSGHYQFNAQDLRRDLARVSWEMANPAVDSDAILVSQLAFPINHIQHADFVKLRDVSISYDLPSRTLHGVARRATLTLAGHNLKIWTKYGGADPELNAFGASTFYRNDLWTVPQTRRYSAAVALGF